MVIRVNIHLVKMNHEQKRFFFFSPYTYESPFPRGNVQESLSSTFCTLGYVSRSCAVPLISCSWESKLRSPPRRLFAFRPALEEVHT